MTSTTQHRPGRPPALLAVAAVALALLVGCSDDPTTEAAAAEPEGEVVGTLGETEVVAVDASAGSEILGEADGWLTSLTPTDRQLRLRSAEPVSQETFLAHVGEQALDWSEANVGVLKQAVSAVGTGFDELGITLPLPDRVAIVFSSGLDEFGFPYTRGNAVILPAEALGMVADGEELSGLLAHELFHVATRAEPALADRLYRELGFMPIAPLVLPDALEDLRMTNPDAPEVAHAIEVRSGGRSVLAAPLDIAAGPYDGAGSFFDVLRSGLIEVDAEGRPVAAGEDVEFLGPDAVRAFRAVVGRDFPDGVFHPEEVLAYGLQSSVEGREQPDTIARDVLVAQLGG